jgi:YHS domain-containing protein
MEKDPVCGMDVDPRTALTAVHDGKTYYFYSTGCRTQF